MLEKNAIVPISRTSNISMHLVGAKAHNLGKLYSLGLSVPKGFVITTSCFDQHFTTHQLNLFIEKELVGIDPANNVRLENASKKIRTAILNIGIDQDMGKAISKAYNSLSGFHGAYVAVRSSCPLENFKSGSLTGQYATFLNIQGEQELINKVKYCWASLFSPQNLFAALSKGYKISSLKTAIIIQKMVQAESSGVMFTLNPIDNDNTKIAIECILGLGDTLTCEQLLPDIYLIKKTNGVILEKKIVPQEWMLLRKGKIKNGEDPNVRVKVSETWRVRQKLENKYIKKLVKIGKNVEESFGQPQSIEWVYESGRIWIVQARPVITLKIQPEDSWKQTPTFTAIKTETKTIVRPKPTVKNKTKIQVIETPKTSPISKRKEEQVAASSPKLKILLSGKGNKEGIVSGPVKIISSSKDISRVKEGTILVAPQIDYDCQNKIKNIVAIVTDKSSKGSSEILLAKSLGIPCIVETAIATKVLRNGEKITVNSSTGQILMGTCPEGERKTQEIITAKTEKQKDNQSKNLDHQTKKSLNVKKRLRRATKIFIDLDAPNNAPDIANKDIIDGVADIGSESIIREFAKHPNSMFENKKAKQEFINTLALGLFRAAKSFDPKPVIYKLSEMSVSGYSNMQNSTNIEIKEENPLLGFRGTSRLIGNPKELELELEAIRIIRNKENIKNVWLAIPYVRNCDDFIEIKHLISNFGFRRSSTFKLFLIVQIPSVAIRIQEFIDIGIDGVIVDIDILSQLLAGTDKNNTKLAKGYKILHPSLIWSIERIVKACIKAKIHSQVWIKTVTSNTSFIKKFIKMGGSSIRTEYSALEQIQQYICDAESNLFMKRKRRN